MKVHFLGDIMLGRGLQEKIGKHPARENLINSINQILPKDDMIIANLEAPFASGGQINKAKDAHLTFKIEPKHISFLKDIGISAVTLANNHMTDFGLNGLTSTISTLRDADIKYTGAGVNVNQAIEPIYFEDQNDKYALLAFNAFVPFSYRAKKQSFGIARFDRATTRKAIEKCENEITGIIITVHWGIDYHEYPVPALLDMATKMLESFPKIIAIIGHHPHLQQPIVFHNGKPIFCSLGNFLFDEPFPLSRIGSILTLDLEKNKIKDHKIQYTILNDDFELGLLKEPLLAEEKNRLNKIAKGISVQDELFILEDKKWIKYLIYQSLRYLSWNDFSYLLELYSIKNILKNLLKR